MFWRSQVQDQEVSRVDFVRVLLFGLQMAVFAGVFIWSSLCAFYVSEHLSLKKGHPPYKDISHICLLRK